MARCKRYEQAISPPPHGGLYIVRYPFDKRDHEALIGPLAAFDPERFPSKYAIQNHLAIEAVAHLSQDGVPLMFQGGTALQLKLKGRTRFSIDVDIRTTDASAVHKSLQEFVKRFSKSDVELVEPPQNLQVDGVRHSLVFVKTADETLGQPLSVHVEVVPSKDVTRGTEPLSLHVDDLDWGLSVPAPTLEGFAAQKLAVLGPSTVGKPVGLNETHARQNQGVCKQIHDLGQILRRDLDGSSFLSFYSHEVTEANSLRETAHEVYDVLVDAAYLIEHLREPRPPGKEPVVAYALWSGFRDSKRWVSDRENWTELTYRTTGGVLWRMVTEMQAGDLRLESVCRPLRSEKIPQETVEHLDRAITTSADWVASDRFAGDILTAWAWSPKEYW